MKTKKALKKNICILVTTAALLITAVPVLAETLLGSALLRERIALPDGLTLQVVIEDIARADAPSIPVGATEVTTTGQPPFAFEITYDPGAIRPQGQYAIRATLRRDGQLLATTDTITRVLDGSTPDRIEVMLRLVSGAADGAKRPVPAHGLRLPASFLGTLPCADCDGIRHHLDLWPDRVYQLSREWLGRPEGPVRRDELGRWYADPERGAIVLYGASEMPLFWQVTAPDRLRQMDMQGNPIVSQLDDDLISDGRLKPTDLERLFLSGEALLGPDGPALRVCLTGQVFLLESGGDFPALAAAVEAGRESPETPLLVSLEARITQPTPGLAPAFPRATVLRFNRAFPGEPCQSPAQPRG